eukprot:TRINITY_DN4954_c4_g1_i2.p1 TRINITY_DN4954_c4_g1~~TRINITY_DN4954_c4_g1_i2.p1  ORF type:complete len:412 (+),score=166.82 TRINITY_DN4954_c4_g1_i2:46-1236(+)
MEANISESRKGSLETQEESKIGTVSHESMSDRLKEIYKGKTRVLAPLVGGSDLSYRLLARKYGAEVTFTEMCISEYFLDEVRKEKKQVKAYTYEFDESDRPLILQLAGNTAQPIIEMANLPMFRGKIDAVDLNCGCPQSFAMEKGYGSGLLKTPDRLVDLCREISSKIPYPLSVKLRLEQDTQHTIDIMTRLKNVGVAGFTIHGRFAWQRGDKRGNADWNAIKEIRSAFPDVTIVGNGDIRKFSDFEAMIKDTGVDAGMVGYGALLDPTLFQVETKTTGEIVSDYLTIARKHKNKWIDILRHLEWMIRKSILDVEQKSRLFQTQNLAGIAEVLAHASPPIIFNLNFNFEVEDGDQLAMPYRPRKASAKAERKLKKARAGNPAGTADPTKPQLHEQW